MCPRYTKNRKVRFHPAKELFFLRRTVSKFWSLAAMAVAEQIPFFQDMDIIFFKKNILIAVT
jgi:hypothetical protein